MDFPINSLILDLTPVLVLDSKSKIKKWNQGLSNIYGWSQPEALGKNAHQLLNTVFPQPLEDIESKIFGKGEWDGVLIHTKKDGSKIVVNSHWILQQDNKAKIFTILEFINDITQNKNTEDSLSETVYKRLVDDSPLAIFLTTLEGNPFIFNPAFARMFGYQSSDECFSLIKNSADLLEDPKRQSEIIHMVQGKNARSSVENLYRRKDGSTFWGNLYAQLVEIRGGSVPYLEAFIEDIAEHMRTLEKLHQAERFTQATLDALAANICVLDESGVILSTNRAWREFAEANGAKDLQHYLGANYLAVCDSAKGKDSEGADVFAEGIRRVMHHEINQFSLEYTCDSPWENRWFIASVTQFNDGESTRLVISHINITERKQAEEGLRESRERLSYLSRRLLETQEQERRRIARELHDEIGQTLTALTITLSGIHQTATDPAVKVKIANLQNLAHELVDQINSLSSDLRPRVLDDLGLIPGLISLFNRLSTQTGIEIDFKHGPLEQNLIPPEIEITAYRIIQEALTNVIRHAKVKLAIVRIQIEEDTLWIQVQDEGKGFNYSTALNSVNSMGLMNMLERAELVGGLVTIQTAPEEGTNITCLLPLSERFIERRKNARN